MLLYKHGNTLDQCKALFATFIYGTFRQEDEYEIEYECSFLNIALMISIVTFHTNLVPFQSCFQLVSNREE